jgi:hypothetical protein
MWKCNREKSALAGATKMSVQDHVEKPIALVNPKRRGKHEKEVRSLDNLLFDAVDETLRCIFREEGAKFILDYLENKCHLNRRRIAEELEDFSAGLDRLLTSARPVVEKLILKNLYSKLELRFEEKEGYRLSDYLKELREKRGC